MVYTALRLVLLVASVGIVFGIWSVFADEVPLFWVVVVAFVLSGVGSFFVLNAPREAFARRVEARASTATAALEERRSREDADEPRSPPNGPARFAKWPREVPSVLAVDPAVHAGFGLAEQLGEQGHS